MLELIMALSTVLRKYSDLVMAVELRKKSRIKGQAILDPYARPGPP